MAYSSELKEQRHRPVTAALVERISVSFGPEPVFQDVSLNIAGGDKIAVVGPNGVGKTTLLRVILGEVEPDHGRVYRDANVRMVYVPQEINEATSVQRIREYFLSARGLDTIAMEMAALEKAAQKSGNLPLRYGSLQTQFEDLGGWQADKDIEAYLSQLDLANVKMDQRVSALSSGVRSRLHLARAIYGNPDLLVLDEPTNHLDKIALKWLRTYLENFDGAALIASHDSDFLRGFITKVLSISGATRTAKEYPGDFSHFEAIEAVERVAIDRLEAKKRVRVSRLADDIQRLGGGSRAGLAHSREKALARESEAAQASSSFKSMEKMEFKQGRPSSQTVLVFEAIDGGSNRQEITRGQRVLVKGDDDQRQLDLLRMMAGLVRPENGRVILGQNVDIGYTGEGLTELSLGRTVLDEFQAQSGGSLSVARQFLGHFSFRKESVHKPIAVLSGGEKSRLSLAIMAAKQPNLLVLNDPTAHLDTTTAHALVGALRMYAGTIVISTKDEELTTNLSFDQTISLN